MYFTSDNKNITDPYSIVNTKLGFKKDIKHFTIDAYFGLNNITGTQYYNMVFVNQLPDSYKPAIKDMNWFRGLNLKYSL
jgi:iron complex outermembrane receptor protein